jgi:DNA-binding MarR family transcriptional regulator
MKNQGDLVDRLISDWRRERKDLEPRAMGIVGRILVLGKYLESRVEKVLKPFGLRYTDLDVLATLRRSGAPFRLRPSELLASVLITSGSLTTCLDRLSSAGLVVREPVPEDRRGCIVKLTRKGRGLTDRAIALRFDQAEGAVDHLSSKERDTLERLLRKLLAGNTP